MLYKNWYSARRAAAFCSGLTAALGLPASLLNAQTLPATSDATPAPAPKPSPSASALTIGGSLRAYDFDRQNEVQNASNPNRSAFNAGGFLRTDYRLPGTALHAGVAYYGAYPFGLNGTRPQANPQIDNSLPGFSLSTLGEAYLRWTDKRLDATVGNQTFNAKWAPASDSRIKPALYQGIDAKYALTRNLTVDVSRMLRFEGRTSSAFARTTLLTSAQAGNPAYALHDTSGLLLAGLAYQTGQYVVASVEDYSFYDIANLGYVEARASLAPGSPRNATFAVQYVNEHQAGRALLGTIRNQTYGAQLAAALSHNVNFAIGYDTAPVKYGDVRAASASAAGKGVFAPAGGTPSALALGAGLYRVAYGGIASPYSEAYATDPLFTTSISQGMVDRHSAGNSYKAALTFTSDNKRVRAILSHAYYDYSNQAGINNTYETNVDVTYFASAVTKGRYRGFSFRERFADRSQATLPLVFRYVRTQLQYDF